MYTLRSQPIFNPMQTTLFKRAHTGTCMDNGYDINSMAALSNLFKLNNPHLSNDQSKDDLLTNQKIVSNLVANNSLSSNLLTNPTAANLLDNFKSSSSASNSNKLKNGDNELYDKLQALSYYQQLQQLNQLQDMPANLLNVQNSSDQLTLARAIQLATELNSSNQINQSTTLQSLIQPNLISSSIQLNSKNLIQSSLTRPTKRQKTIPNPIQITHSNFNSTKEQLQPLDLSIKSASSTNSERFIIEPLNLSRSNSPEGKMEQLNATNLIDCSKIDNNISALCKKKRIVQRRTAELIKKSSCSSAPCSPSSIATSSSPSDQPFDLDTSQSNLEICLSLDETVVNHLNKKRKFSDSSFNLDNSTSTTNLIANLPKLQAKRRRVNKQQQTKSTIINNEETLEAVSTIKIQQQRSDNQPQKPSTIIIDAKNTFTCPTCGEMFAFKDRLSKHIKSKHKSKIDQNDLTNGSSKAIQPSQSSTNGRNSPNQQKNYQCPDCYRCFARSDMLTRHSRTHSGLKPYKCEICKSRFTRSDHLATHKRTHSGDKPYKCSKCDYTACRRDMITRHMKTHNGDKNKSSNGVVQLVPTDANKIKNAKTSVITESNKPDSSTMNDKSNDIKQTKLDQDENQS